MRVLVAALVSLLSACSSSNLHYSALEPYPPVDELLAKHGNPDEEIAWSRDHWTGSVCVTPTRRACSSITTFEVHWAEASTL